MTPKQPPSLGEAVARIMADPGNRVGPPTDVPPPAPGEAAKQSEEEFQREVIAYARTRGWRVAHFRKVRVARPDGTTYWQTPVQADGAGWPDLVLVRKGEIVFAELKVGKNTATPEQVAWLDDLRETGAAAGVWRPGDWPAIKNALD